MDTPLPYAMAGLFFLFPIVFFCVLFWTRYKNRPEKLYLYMGITLVLGFWIYAGLVFNADPLGLIRIEPNELNIFVAVVFASSPGVFRIVRGLAMDIKTRDYVAAAQTRGESPWYIMLWEILPNARGPLIVDACLRIGYTTILLGTLGYFGLGLAPEKPGLGHGDQGRQPAAALVHPPGTAADDRADELRARPQPARRRAARAVDEGLKMSPGPRFFARGVKERDLDDRRSAATSQPESQP